MKRARDRVLTTGMIARVLGRDRVTIWRWIRAGHMPGRRVGGRFLVSGTAFEGWQKTLQNVAR